MGRESKWISLQFCLLFIVVSSSSISLLLVLRNKTPFQPSVFSSLLFLHLIPFLLHLAFKSTPSSLYQSWRSSSFFFARIIIIIVIMNTSSNSLQQNCLRRKRRKLQSQVNVRYSQNMAWNKMRDHYWDLIEKFMLLILQVFFSASTEWMQSLDQKSMSCVSRVILVVIQRTSLSISLPSLLSTQVLVLSTQVLVLSTCVPCHVFVNLFGRHLSSSSRVTEQIGWEKCLLPWSLYFTLLSRNTNQTVITTWMSTTFFSHFLSLKNMTNVCTNLSAAETKLFHVILPYYFCWSRLQSQLSVTKQL